MAKELTKYHGFPKFKKFGGKSYYELIDLNKNHNNVFNVKSTADSVAKSKRKFGYKTRVIPRMYKKKQKYLVYQKYSEKYEKK